MAAISSISNPQLRDVFKELTVAETICEKVPEIVLNLKTGEYALKAGEYILKAPLTKKAEKVGLKVLAKIYAISVGSVWGGALGSF